MLSENLKLLRKSKGYTQEEFASRLHVVRQTISKWEKGISVPDADLLMKVAEILGVSVGELLGANLEREASENGIAEQLSHINEQLAIRNRRSRRIWRGIAAIFVAILVIDLVIAIAGITTYRVNSDVEIETSIVSVGE